MLNPFISLVVYLTEMSISYFFFSRAFERKYCVGKVLGIGCILFSIGSIANILCHNNTVINILISIILNNTFAWICFNGKSFLNFFYSFILVIIGITWELIAISVVSVLTDRHFLEYNSDFALFILECPISKMFYFFTILGLSGALKSEKQAAHLPLPLFLYPLTTIVCHIIFWYICAQTQVLYETQSLLAVASLILLVSTVLLFITYQNQIEKDRESMQIKNEYARLQTEKTYYIILEQQNEHLMVYAHDAKKHLAAINSLNEDPQIGNYISKLSEQLADYTRYCHSGNKLLDVMIHKYSVDCELRGIHFEYDVKSCNLSDISDLDLVAILGNLMDNAVTAAEHSREKYISLATSWRNDYSVVIISNSSDCPPKAVGGTLVTSKRNFASHGFGLKSVKQALKNYEGDFDWSYDAQRHMFTVTVMLGSKVAPMRV